MKIMKRVFLLLIILFFFNLVRSQCPSVGPDTTADIEFFIESPSSILGAYSFSSTNDVAGWGSPDLTQIANAITDTLMFVEDGTTGTNPQGNPISQEGCSPLINNLTGKIAVIWRNSCQFGQKILNAENAGAVAAIIINREPGLVSMAPGDDGANVTIPALFIEYSDGVVLANEMNNGPVTAFIGARNFNKNIALKESGIIRPKTASVPKEIAQNGNEYSVDIGAWVYNDGMSFIQGIQLQSEILYNSNILHTVSSSTFDLCPSDSIFIRLPTFSKNNYSVGNYSLVYNIILDSIDDKLIDNSITQAFHISNQVFSHALLDSNENLVFGPYYRPSNATGSVSVCTPFIDSNASRLIPEGISFAAQCSGCDLSGRYFATYLHEWNDVFTDLNDPNATISNINTIGYGE